MVCSTPYGIRGLAQADLNRRHEDFQPMCSTPYGIRGLAPSNGTAVNLVAFLCSTPYGIRGLAPSNGTAVNLVAFLCSTPYGIRGLAPTGASRKTGRLRSAQRLTASEVWHLKSRSVITWQSSAQRLTASEVWHDMATVQAKTKEGCSTPYGIRGLAPPQSAPADP